MSKLPEDFTRRDFLRTVGAATALPFAAQGSLSAAEPAIPKRPFGKSGVDVPILSLGGMFDVPGNQVLLKWALRKGVTYWDTADCYEGGNSERGFGKYFARNPDDRKKVFLVTKADDREPGDLTRLLDRSLKRLNTDYVDLFLAHNIGAIREVDRDATRKWAETMKSKGRIRLFGFSTHRNVPECLRPAARMGWIDGIMFSYNYRTMNDAAVKSAVEACHAAGIGMTTMKFRGYGPVPADYRAGRKLVARFVKSGLTEDQAMLRAIWEDRRISSVCALMKNMGTLKSFVGAARGSSKLSLDERRALEEHAEVTSREFCAGCSRICEPATEGGVPVADVMRYLMYHHGYGEHDRASGLFREIPEGTRASLGRLDYSAAERLCPNRLPIARLMAEATRVLA